MKTSLYTIRRKLHFARLMPYRMPVLLSTVNRISHPSGEYDHKNFIASYYAVDFIVPIDTHVYASAGGVIVNVKDDSDEWGLDTSLSGKANLVIIDHKNGFFSEYIHLQKGEVYARVGDRVKRGQLLGKTGNSGCMDIPHLHFNVFTNRGGIESVPPGFLFFKTAFVKKEYEK